MFGLALTLSACDGSLPFSQGEDCYDVGGCEGAVDFSVLGAPVAAWAGDTLRLRIALADSTKPEAASYRYAWYQIARADPYLAGSFIVPRSDGQGEIRGAEVTRTTTRSVRWVAPAVEQQRAFRLRGCVDIDGNLAYYNYTCRDVVVTVSPRA